MEKENIPQLLFFFFFFTFFILTAADDNCRPASCGPLEPEVRFPFYITGRQPAHCGYPGFSLICNEQNQTIIQLPSAHSYIVNRINYVSQVMSIDPDFCRRNQIPDFNLTDTPFDSGLVQSYTFYNCSLQTFGFVYPEVRVRCGNYLVIAVPDGLLLLDNVPSSCEVMKTIAVPGRWNPGVGVELMLMWFTPYCRSCEIEGGTCGLNYEDGQLVCHGSSRGISTTTRYGLILGMGLPASIGIIVLICCMASRARESRETHPGSIDLFSIAIVPQPPITTGLSGSIIKSYPKTMLGESCRLPDDGNTCAICLSEYKPKESIRTIPKCDHYFHADCIDEWLKLNATCPVCRNSPGGSSLVTPSSSTSTNNVDS